MTVLLHKTSAFRVAAGAVVCLLAYPSVSLAQFDRGEALYQNHGIVLRPFPQAGLNSLRVSPNLMNSEEELHRLLAILERVG